jgi:hypothetical protein
MNAIYGFTEQLLYEPLDGTIYIARVVHGGRDLSGVVFPRFE